ncbi:MAG: HAD-IB family phosphatase [Alphaproteobacteria bacterium]|nr:HAD-IB family phosphatase [Alphaproteobacteria bacterium]
MTYLTLVSPQFLDNLRVTAVMASLSQADWPIQVAAWTQSSLASDAGTLRVLQLQLLTQGSAPPPTVQNRNQWLLTLADEFACDFAWQAGAPAPKRLAGFDMDGTTVAEESMVLLAQGLNQPGGDLVQQMTALTDAAMGTGISFEESLLQRLALLAGSPYEAFVQASQRFTVNPGMATAVAAMNGAGTLTALITGGYDPMKSTIASRLGFRQSFGNSLIFDDNNRFTGDCQRPILGKAAKAEILQNLAAQHGWGAKDSLFIGDGSNDLGALQWVMAGNGLAVGWRPKPMLLSSLNAIVQHNAASLLAFQGLGGV